MNEGLECTPGWNAHRAGEICKGMRDEKASGVVRGQMGNGQRGREGGRKEGSEEGRKETSVGGAGRGWLRGW